MLAGTNLGVVLLAGGLALALVVWIVLRVVQRRSGPHPIRSTEMPLEADTGDEGIIVVEPGGRLDFVNARARSWFEVPAQDAPHLDWLLRRVRPSDDFLDLCAQPGRKRLNLNGQPVEATSSRVPGSYPRMLISIRGLEAAMAGGDVGHEGSSSLVRIISDFGGAISASLDLESVVRSVLDSTLRLIPADVLELKTWNRTTQLLSTYRLVEANGRLAHVALVEQSQFGELSQQVIAARSPVWLTDRSAILAASGDRLIGASCYLGIPLIAGDELVGVLEAAQTGTGGFTDQERDLTALIAPQIATALRNSILYEQEHRRSLEYSGLAGVAQAVGSAQQPREFFSRLVDAVAPLFDARIVGFLLLDEQ
ncbi:MAG TPA: GAF domain-containing protein, partial [Anaerolineales bacterium]|nr:GAF domain-containing protein [Anaerolineales bacterium]